MSTDSSTKSVIGHSTADKVVLYGGLPLAGLALGFFLPRIADWAVDQRWVPFQGPLELIAKADSWRVVAPLTVIGVVAGIFLAAAALEDTLKVTVTNTEVEFLKNQKTTRVPRNQVAVAFLDGNAVLKARSKAFALGDKGKHDVRELREEVAKLGYTVRDEDKRQYWRPTTH